MGKRIPKEQRSLWPKNLKSMTREEISLLTFFETCMVDNTCKVKGAHMNNQDIEIGRRWDAMQFIEFRRIKSHELTESRYGYTHEVRFTPRAWELAHKARRARGGRSVTQREKQLEAVEQ